MCLLLYVLKAVAYSIQHVGCLSLLLVGVGVGVGVVTVVLCLFVGLVVGDFLELLHLEFYVF